MRSGSFINGPEVLSLDDGTALHLLPAMEVLCARNDAKTLSAEICGDPALCANACILARAWKKRGKPICEDGAEILALLSVSQIQALAKRWAEFDRRENPGFGEAEERIDALKKASGTCTRSAFNGMCCAIFGRSQRIRASKK